MDIKEDKIALSMRALQDNPFEQFVKENQEGDIVNCRVLRLLDFGAFVELKPGKTATAEELIAFCKQHLARFKVPKDVVITEIPKTSTGKLQKFILRDWAKERATGEFQ